MRNQQLHSLAHISEANTLQLLALAVNHSG
jgi:hypothetical protein